MGLDIIMGYNAMMANLYYQLGWVLNHLGDMSLGVSFMEFLERLM